MAALMRATSETPKSPTFFWTIGCDFDGVFVATLLVASAASTEICCLPTENRKAATATTTTAVRRLRILFPFLIVRRRRAPATRISRVPGRDLAETHDRRSHGLI